MVSKSKSWGQGCGANHTVSRKRLNALGVVVNYPVSQLVNALLYTPLLRSTIYTIGGSTSCWKLRINISIAPTNLTRHADDGSNANVDEQLSNVTDYGNKLFENGLIRVV